MLHAEIQHIVEKIQKYEEMRQKSRCETTGLGVAESGLEAQAEGGARLDVLVGGRRAVHWGRGENVRSDGERNISPPPPQIRLRWHN